MYWNCKIIIGIYSADILTNNVYTGMVNACIITNLSYTSSYLQLIEILVRKSTYGFPFSYYKFGCNHHCLLHHRGVLNINTLTILIWKITVRWKNPVRTKKKYHVIPLTHVFPSFFITNPSSQAHAYLSLTLLQIWLQPPLRAVSQGCTVK